MKAKLEQYIEVELKSDLSNLSPETKKIIPFLIKVSDIIDDIFWLQTYGDREKLLAKTNNENYIKYIFINYGPWDRLNNDEPFIKGIGTKFPG